MLIRIKTALKSPDGIRRLADFVFASLLFSLPQPVRRRIYSGSQHYCPVCKTALTQFLRLHRPYHLWCPVCRSLQRHRLVWLLIEQHQLLAKLEAGGSARMLHFAPEPCLQEHFRGIAGVEYTSADLYDRSAMLKIDITDIPLPDASFDFIYCSHVLEHVPDDRRAIHQLNRVLRPGGWAMILVPIGGESTDEDPSITDPRERELRFGQLDHVRVYGMDIVQRLQQGKFEVQVLTVSDLEPGTGDVKRLGLDSADKVFLCQKPVNQ